jgi:chemotaxis protein MotD
MMRLGDIAAMPTSVREVGARQGGQIADGERSFGDLLEKEALHGGLALDAVPDEATRTDDRAGGSGRKDGAMAPDGTADDTLLGSYPQIGNEARQPSRLSERFTIDWLSLRALAEATPADETQEVDTEAVIDTDLGMIEEPALPLADGQDATAEGGIAALPGKRSERSNDGEAGGRTMRSAAASLSSAAAGNLDDGNRQGASLAPDDGDTDGIGLRQAAERFAERRGQDAPRQSPTPISSVSVQTVPAPSLEPQTPSRIVIAALNESAPEMARPVAATVMQQQQAVEPMRILRIQLHPLELGMVTAKLSLQGGTMAVELQAETREAAARLAADSQDIVRSLRGLGIEVDRVTVTQSTASSEQQNEQQTGNFERGERFAGDAAERGNAREQGGRSATGGGLAGSEERDLQPSPDRSGVFI